MDKRAELFMGNEYWAQYYNNAPTEACKRFVELQFINSVAEITSKEASGWSNIKSSLTKNDWEHLLKYAGNNPFKLYCRKKIAEFKI